MDYYEECVVKSRDKRRVRYPNPNFGAMSEPCILVDTKGRIVLWYLPGLLSKKQMVRVFIFKMKFYWTEMLQSDVRKGTVAIGPLLKKSVASEKPNKPAPNWRIHMRNFVKKSRTHFCEPGSVTFSAGWLGQGHTVRQFCFLST
jgi:hypothetical protein